MSRRMWLSRQKSIFISYSHQDRQWLERIRKHFQPFIKRRKISLFADIKIKLGADWRSEIKRAIAGARVAVLLVSPNFLSSEFIVEKELPPILKAAGNKKLRILWIAISPCAYKETDIAKYQALNSPDQPLDTLSEPEQNKVLVEICEKICDAADGAPAIRLTRSVKVGFLLVVAVAVVLLAGYHQLFYRLRRVMPGLCPIHLTKAQSNGRMSCYFTRTSVSETNAPLRVYQAEGGVMREVKFNTHGLIPAGGAESLHYVSDIQVGENSWTAIFLWTPAFYTSVTSLALSAGSATDLLLVVRSQSREKLRVGLKDVHEHEQKVGIDLEPGLNVCVIPIGAFDEIDLDRIIFMLMAHEGDYALEDRMKIEVLRFTFMKRNWQGTE